MNNASSEKITFSKNTKINSFIYHCFECISESDKQKFVKGSHEMLGDLITRYLQPEGFYCSAAQNTK